MLAKALAGGGRAVALFNETGAGRDDLDHGRRRGRPRARDYSVRNLWANTISERRGTISAFVPARHRDVHRDRAPQASRRQAPAAHGAVTRLRLDAAPARRVDHRGRVVHQRRHLGRQAGCAVAVGVAGVAGQAARPDAGARGRGRPAVHGLLPGHRPRVWAAARHFDPEWRGRVREPGRRGRASVRETARRTRVRAGGIYLLGQPT